MKGITEKLDVKFKAFLTYPWGKGPGIHWIGSQAGHRTSLSNIEK
jgi:hypothetical protein